MVVWVMVICCNNENYVPRVFKDFEKAQEEFEKDFKETLKSYEYLNEEIYEYGINDLKIFWYIIAERETIQAELYKIYLE